MPFAYHQLAMLEMKDSNFDITKNLLNKVKENFKDYDFENRLVPQVMSAQKKLKFILDKNSEKRSNSTASASSIEKTAEKNYKANNFYV